MGEASAIFSVNKARLSSRDGVSYAEFRATLKPRYFLVWRDILLAYAALAAVLLATGRLQFLGVPVWITMAAAVPVGYVLAYIHLFIHEAAHYNLAADRRVNDILANLFVGLVVGVDIARYRTVHFDHHRHLGTTRDPERTYFDRLGWRFILDSLTGVRVLKVMTARGGREDPPRDGKPAGERHMLLAGTAANLAFVVALCVAGFVHVAAVWVVAIGGVFPFFVAIRQVLEHRSERARPDVDYAQVDHGAVNRLFGDSLLARTLGGAGFNRHLLHHWEPQLSYTRLRDLEHFLMSTEMAPTLDGLQTTYSSTFLRLFNR